MTRQPRPLVPSASLLRVLNECGGLSVTGLRGSRKKKPTLSLVALTRLEEEIGAQLHDDILVLLALRDPVAALFTGIADVNAVADASEHEAPEGWVCISTVYSDPVGELVADAHGAAYIDIAVPKQPSHDEARIITAWDGIWGKPEDTQDQGEPLGEFIEQMIYEATSGEHGDAVLGRGGASTLALNPTPKLVRGRQLRRAKTTGGRVSHSKFGVGEVLDRSGEGESEKLVVAFADKQRTLLARFVQPAD